ncbi:unnamed protein product [Effrenium voratum]|nr:unnamed protein product [Effrenium voratum]
MAFLVGPRNTGRNRQILGRTHLEPTTSPNQDTPPKESRGAALLPPPTPQSRQKTAKPGEPPKPPKPRSPKIKGGPAAAHGGEAQPLARALLPGLVALCLAGDLQGDPLRGSAGGRWAHVSGEALLRRLHGGLCPWLRRAEPKRRELPRVRPFESFWKFFHVHPNLRFLLIRLSRQAQVQWLPGALHRLVRSFPDPRPAVHHHRAPRPRRADTGLAAGELGQVPLGSAGGLLRHVPCAGGAGRFKSSFARPRGFRSTVGLGGGGEFRLRLPLGFGHGLGPFAPHSQQAHHLWPSPAAPISSGPGVVLLDDPAQLHWANSLVFALVGACYDLPGVVLPLQLSAGRGGCAALPLELDAGGVAVHREGQAFWRRNPI